jgi:hypothetical protein
MKDQEQPKAPSKEEVIAFLKEQIEVKSVQLELQKINTSLAIEKAEELKALSIIGQITNPGSREDSYKGGTPHILTKEDMELNPELAEEGLKEGDTIVIPDGESVESLKDEASTVEKKSKSLKK